MSADTQQFGACENCGQRKYLRDDVCGSCTDHLKAAERISALEIALRNLYNAIPDNEGGALGKACKEARALLPGVKS